jgi:hypothetical protein
MKPRLYWSHCIRPGKQFPGLYAALGASSFNKEQRRVAINS